MPTVLEIARQAATFRRHLRLARLPELKLLCALRFFAAIEHENPATIESYAREFGSELGEAARRSSPHEFLPEEIAGVARLHRLLAVLPGDVLPSEDLRVIERLIDPPGRETEHPAEAAGRPASEVRVACLFVEHYPDLDLSPRPRLLHLHVQATPISRKAESDDVVVREQPDDRYHAQAEQSVHTVRTQLANMQGVSADKRFRFDFTINSTGARLTGDSLGVAFAIGAIAALDRVEVFRERPAVPLSAAFSGALMSSGELSPVDSEGLRLKIYRAFYSDLRYLVIPRQHVTDAWTYVRDLENEAPERKLEVVGSDDLASIVNDPRLVPRTRTPSVIYLGRKLAAVRRPWWLDVAIIVLLLAVLLVLLAPTEHMPWYDANPATASFNLTEQRLEVFNSENRLLWTALDGVPCRATSSSRVIDINNDGSREVIALPWVDVDHPARQRIFLFSDRGALLFDSSVVIDSQYPGDTSGVLYHDGPLEVVNVNDEWLLMTQISQSNPARSLIKWWDGSGQLRGWYVHAGVTDYLLEREFHNDGKEGLLFKGINNRMQRAAVFVLRANGTHGCSPPYEDTTYDLSWIEHGNQSLYTLLPVTDVGNLLLQTNYNDIVLSLIHI